MEDTEQYAGFEWDQGKSEATCRDRGIDFSIAALVFEKPHWERRDARREYGETRFLVTGIITAWPATKREEIRYREHRARNDRSDPQK